jgi:hypothetical protein
MRNRISIEGTFETPTQMIDAVRARIAQQTLDEAEEERLAEEAAASDPEVAAWVRAAEAEDAATEYRTMVATLYGQQKTPAA